MDGVNAGKVVELMPARGASGYHDCARLARTNGWKQHPFADRARHLEVLPCVSPGPGHAAAA